MRNGNSEENSRTIEGEERMQSLGRERKNERKGIG